MSSRIMREFLGLGNNNKNNDKMEIDEPKIKENFLENNETSFSHLKNISTPFIKQNIHNNLLKKNTQNIQDNDDIYYNCLKDVSEKQDKVKKELIDELNNTSSPFSDKIDKYLIKDKFEYNLNKKQINQKKKNQNDNIKQKILTDYFNKV